MSMYRVFSCVVGRGCLLWPVHFLGKTLLVFALLHSVFQGQICLLLQVFLFFPCFNSKFYFIFKLYNIVLVLPNIDMNPPQVWGTRVYLWWIQVFLDFLL